MPGGSTKSPDVSVRVVDGAETEIDGCNKGLAAVRHGTAVLGHYTSANDNEALAIAA